MLAIGFAVIGFVLWFVLNSVNIELAKEIAILVTIILYSGLIAGALHDKGILPSPNKIQFRVKNGLVKYKRKHFLKNEEYERINYKKNSYSRNIYRNSNK
ncbi:MAG: hypothetical protein ACTSO7_01670 [Candidatus Heimdallarchaeota archaeon]